MDDKEIEEVLNEFFKKLAENQEDLETDFQKVLYDNLWELLQDEDSN
jgi:hypothetical protein